MNMLNALPSKSENIFGKANYNFMENQFIITKKRLATKLQNPRLMQIHFHILRHEKQLWNTIRPETSSTS